MIATTGFKNPDKKVVKAIDLLTVDLKKGFNKPCKEQSIDCINCQGQRLLTYLEWYKDMITWA